MGLSDFAEREHPGKRSATAPRLSVAICTRDRVEQLDRALGSLLEQSDPPDEILVVDNAPRNDATERLVAELFPSVRYLCEKTPGLNFARNRALREATGEVLAFLDDDAVAHPAWVLAVRRAFADRPEIGACTGRIEPLALETEAQRLFEANGGLFASGREPFCLPADRIRSRWHRWVPNVAWAAGAGSGCNFAVRRDLILELGGFDEALDLGRALPGGGDNDILWRILDAGREVRFEPQARVRHEHRKEMDAVVEQILGHQRALVALATKATLAARGWRRLPALAFLGWRLVKPGFRLLRRIVGRDPLPAGILLRAWGHCWGGLLAYPRGRQIANDRKAAG